MEYRKQIEENNIKSNFTGFATLANLFSELDVIAKDKNTELIWIDLANVKKFDSNLFAMLSAKCVYYSLQGTRIRIINFPRDIENKISYYRTKDKNNTKKITVSDSKSKKDLINYNEFRSGDSIGFNSYIRRIFENDNYNIPSMTPSLKNRILEGLGEVFGNVKMHTDSDKVFVCGQVLFGSSNRLDVTIVNIGKTIKETVAEYCQITGKEMPTHCIEWCTVDGNTTKINKTGGLGLATIKDFASKNEGKLHIVSDNEYYQLGKRNMVNTFKSGRFNGTAVNIEINLNDKKSYRLSTDIDINNFL